MRIISGKARGLRLNTPPGKGQTIRPTSDRCREALFSILMNNVQGGSILDLFAGTGAFGLEAMSRGAKSVVFVDKNPLAIKLVKKNIAAFQHCVEFDNLYSQNMALLQRDLRKGLIFLVNNPRFQLDPFNIIFIDPPYSKGLALPLLKEIDQSQLLAENGIIVIEESSKNKLTLSLNTLTRFDKRVYGDTTFWFYTYK